MRFGPNVVEHAPFSIPMIGNTATGYSIGLTPEGAAVCHRMFSEDVTEAEVAAVHADLPAHLRRGGFVVEDVEADDVTLGKGVEGVERAEGVGAGNAAAAASAPSASAVPAPLQSAYLHVTHHCNLNCIGCYSAVDARNTRRDLTLDELRGITIDADENIRIGSLTSFSHITRDPIIQQYINVLGEAVDMVGGPQIRNIGTIGGNTCNGVTSADSSSTLHAWDAIVELTGKNGVRRLPIHEFYIKAGKVDIRAEDGEIQTAILIPKESYDRCYGHYIKYAMRNAMDIATLGCSVNVRLSEDKKTIERARIAYGVAGPVPLRCASAEAAAQGKPLTEETVETFAHTILDDINPRDSWRASKAFRQHIAVEIAKRCLVKSIELAGGELA